MEPIVIIALVILAAVLAVALVIAVRRRRAQELQAQARHEEQVRQNLARVARDVRWDPSVRRLRAGNERQDERTPVDRR